MIKNVILILGPQGSGKSTQAIQLAEFLNYHFISSGQEIRKVSESNTPLAEKLKSFWKDGHLVPDELVEKEIIFPLMEASDKNGFVIDGYPRNIEQINSFLNFLDKNEWAISHVFFLFVGEEECVKRLKIRQQTENREDETDELIKERLKVYHQETEPLLAEYMKMGRLHRIDGERDIESIQSDMRNYFNAIEFVEPKE